MAAKSDIEAGRSFVSLFVKDAAFTKGMNAASAKLKAFGGGVTAVGGVIAASGAAILGSLGAAVNSFMQVGDELDKMSGRTGVSAQALAELGYAARQSGASANDVEAGLRKLSKVLIDAGRGGKTSQESLAALGLTLEDLNGLSPDQQFEKLAESISKVEDPMRRAALAQEVFGKSGTKLLPLMASGAKGIAALREQAKGLGIFTSDEDVKNAVVLGDTWADVKESVMASVFQIGAALAPTLISIAEKIRSVASVVAAWIRENREVFLTLAKIATGAVAVGSALMAMGGLITAAGIAVGAIAPLIVGLVAAAKVAFIVIGGAIGLLISPIGIVTALVVGLGTAWLTMGESGKIARDSLASGFRSVLEVGKQVFAVFAGITKALLRGEFSTAGRIAFLGLKLAALEALIGIQSIFKMAVTNLALLWNKGIDGWLLSWGNFGQAIMRDIGHITAAWEALQRGAWQQALNLAGQIGSGSQRFDMADFIAGAFDDATLKAMARRTREELQAELDKLRAPRGVQGDAGDQGPNYVPGGGNVAAMAGKLGFAGFSAGGFLAATGGAQQAPVVNAVNQVRDELKKNRLIQERLEEIEGRRERTLQRLLVMGGGT